MAGIDLRLVGMARELVLEGFGPRYGELAETFESDPLWRRLAELGSRLWLDTGDLDEAGRLWTREFDALTTNNSLLNAEVQKGTYDELIATAGRRLRSELPELAPAEVVREVAFLLNARHGLRLVEAFDAHVSVELHTDLAGDLDATVAYGLRYRALCPERFIVKVPLTAEGLLAARRLASERVAVNLTLGFSARQNVLTAILAMPQYANVFLGRLNQLADQNGLGDGRNVGERTVSASQRLLAKLRQELTLPTRQIAASLRSGSQIAALAGVDVLTLPPRAAHELLTDAPSPQDIPVGIEQAFDVRWADPARAAALGVEDLWRVPTGLEAAVRRIATTGIETLGAPELRRRLDVEGYGDLLPDWSDADIARARQDGKIPKLEAWRDRLSRGTIGLDALMSLHGLQAFAADQEKMDQRIRGILDL